MIDMVTSTLQTLLELKPILIPQKAFKRIPMATQHFLSISPYLQPVYSSRSFFAPFPIQTKDFLSPYSRCLVENSPTSFRCN